MTIPDSGEPLPSERNEPPSEAPEHPAAVGPEPTAPAPPPIAPNGSDVLDAPTVSEPLTTRNAAPVAPIAPPAEVVYVPLAVTVGDGFKLGCGFFMAAVVTLLAGVVVIAALLALGVAMGVSLPVERYVALEEFDQLKAEARALGFRHVECGPLVRSSYHAHDALPARD